MTEPSPSLEMRTTTALLSALVLKLVQNGSLSLEDAIDIFEASLTVLEDQPLSDQTAQLRLFVERVASLLSAKATDQERRR